jgi:Mannosyltransferase (PIG-V)
MTQAVAQKKHKSEPDRSPTIARTDVKIAFRYSLKIFLVMRIGLTLVALASIALVPLNQTTDVPGWPAPQLEQGASNIGTAFERWDALWFLRIADSGYAENDGSAAFFPLYPMAVKAVSTVIGGHPLPAAIIVSNAAFLVALVVVFLLTRLEFDEETARRTTLYMSVWPTAFFFIAPYSESLFLLLAAGSVLFARLKQWPIAALMGALAAGTRSIGIVLVGVLAIEAWLQYRERTDRKPAQLIRPLAWSAGAAVGTLAYLAYWKAVSGNWFAPVGEQANWQREFSFPLATIWDGTKNAFKFVGVDAGGYVLLDWLVVMPALALAVWVIARMRATYGLYALISFLVPLSLIFGGRPFMSLPRFTLVIWPLFWGLAHLARKWNAHEAIVACSAVMLGLFTVLHVNWYWIF